MAQVNINIRTDEKLKNDFKLERKKSLTSVLDSFGTCSKEENEEISKRLASLSEDDKKVVKFEVIDL